MYPDFQKEASMILDKSKDDKEAPEKDGMDMASEEMMKSFHAKDTAGLKDAMRSFIDVHNSSKDSDDSDMDEME